MNTTGLEIIFIFGGCALRNEIAEKTTTIALAHHVFFLPVPISRELPLRFRQETGESQCHVWLYHLKFLRNFGP